MASPAIDGGRDQSPTRSSKLDSPLKQTQFYKVAKLGKGWSVQQSCSIQGRWSHYEVQQMTDLPAPLPFKQWKRKWIRDIGITPYASAVFLYDIVAPSEIILVIWVGMKKRRADMPRTMAGIYTRCNWPDEMTPEQYKKSQEY